MPTVVSCSCGKKLNVRDELIGKKVKCPACGGVLTVAAEVSVISAADVVEDDDAPPARKPAPPGKPPPGKPPPVPGKSAPGGPPPRPSKEPRAEDDEDRAPAKSGAAVWRCLSGGQSRLLCLTDEGILFADVDKKTMKRIEADLADGQSPQEAFGDDPGFIPWGSVTLIDSNLKQDNFNVNFTHTSGDSSQMFRFEDKRERTDALKWMRDNLAPEFDYSRRALNSFQATFQPLIVIGIMILVFGFLTWLAWGLQQPREGGGRVRTNIWGLLVAYTVGWLGPLWTGVLGGVCILGCVAWMGVRIADPPIEVKIKPKSEKKRKAEDEDDEEEEDERPRSKGKRRRPRDED